MFSKILFTLAVIFACMWVLANRAPARSRLREIPNPEVEKRRKAMRLASYAFMALMIVAACVMLYLQATPD